MKNVFKKTVALVSAMSLMAAGSALSVSASSTEIELEVLTLDTTSGEYVSDATAKAGETVEIQIATVNSAGFQLDTIGLRNIINGESDTYAGEGKLELVSYDPDSAVQGIKDENCQFMISLGSPKKLSADKTVLITYKFTVPEDAQVGDVFNLGWAEDGSYRYSLKDSTTSTDDIASTKKPGTITIVSDEIVTTVVTTEEPIVTTEEEIVTTAEEVVTTTEETSAVTTTTTTAATTTAATTTTKATTTSKAASSPATGSSSNGVAALAVTMVAAAGAAIALKKKED